ncbi:MAG: hypothetical protein HYY52_01100 [Candidatus Melainabacteria bacterium]|nr:hypothetical protein [Candidatus Melainabacteria bacterium]
MKQILITVSTLLIVDFLNPAYADPTGLLPTQSYYGLTLTSNVYTPPKKIQISVHHRVYYYRTPVYIWNLITGNGWSPWAEKGSSWAEPIAPPKLTPNNPVIDSFQSSHGVYINDIIPVGSPFKVASDLHCTDNAGVDIIASHKEDEFLIPTGQDTNIITERTFYHGLDWWAPCAIVSPVTVDDADTDESTSTTPTEEQSPTPASQPVTVDDADTDSPTPTPCLITYCAQCPTEPNTNPTQCRSCCDNCCAVSGLYYNCLAQCPTPTPTSSPSPSPTPSPTPKYEDIVSCSSTTAGLCSEVNAACSYKNTSNGDVFKGKCKNETTTDGLKFCGCSLIEDTAEGCTQWISEPLAGRCLKKDQTCTIQGSGPNGGKKGICTNIDEVNAEGLPVSTCSCQLPPFEDIVSCSRTTAGLCSEVNAACSFRNNSNDQVINGKCKNTDSGICICDITENTADGCTYYIGGGAATGACFIPNQECTYQGPPGDPNNGSRGVCVTRTEIDIDSSNEVLRCRCNEKAVCGDDRIDKEQGEVCDPPDRVGTGCYEDWNCSPDCKSCIPSDPCLEHSGAASCGFTQCGSGGTQRNCAYDEDTGMCYCPVVF